MEPGARRRACWLLALVVKEAQPPKELSSEHRTIEPSERRGDPRHRVGQTYLVGAEPAIEGQGGSDRLFAVCCRLMYSALPLDDLRQLVEEVYNPRCEPPWTTERIEHKLEDADRVFEEPRGLCSTRLRRQDAWAGTTQTNPRRTGPAARVHVSAGHARSERHPQGFVR